MKINKKLITACLLVTILTIAGCSTQTQDQINDNTNKKNDGSQTTNIGKLDFNYILDNASGSCSGIADCQEHHQPCGNPQCTNPNHNAEAVEENPDTCPIDLGHPKNDNYNCGCVPNENKCGWIK